MRFLWIFPQIEAMMLKLQRLQQKAILEDDYDTGGPGAAPGVVSTGGSSHRRLGRRPGYLRLQDEDRRSPVYPTICAVSPSHSAPLEPGLASDPPPSSCVSHGGQRRPSHTPSVSNPAPLDRPLPHSSLRPDSPRGTDSLPPPARDQFTSSFSFIRLSLTSDPRTDRTPPPSPGPGAARTDQPVTAVTDKPLDPAGERWVSRESSGGHTAGHTAVTPELKDLLPDLDSCSLSLDSSDSASASSVTSGYESATPCGGGSATPCGGGSATPCGDTWGALLRRYEGILQDCLHSNRTNAQIEAMMLKLQRLQQKAILEDDYDTAERFGQKLEELRGEKSSLRLGLPSRHPALSHLLERLRVGVCAALQETAGSHSGEMQQVAVEERGRGSPLGRDSTQDPRKRREHLLQEKKLVQEEMQTLRCRMQELQRRSQRLEEELLQDDQLGEELLQEEEHLEEGVAPALRSCSPAQLQELSRALDDLVTSEHHAQIYAQPPPLLLRLKEQEEALKACIKETTAKVVMSQRVGGGLQRKVSASETQLLALHEAKLAAISGSDFSSAKELKAELKALYGERDRLESLARRLQALSSGNSRELARMKSEHSLLKQDLEHRQAQYETTQRENTLKYIELLEEKLHSCGNSVLERLWEADLEACHLLLRAPSCCGPGGEEVPATQAPPPEPHPKQEQDCAMLMALGGRWCSDTGLQHSEFTKKLEEFLFCMEDSQDPCDVNAEVTGVTEQCELIGRRLESLEEQLQTAISERDHALAHILTLPSTYNTWTYCPA
ncbi:hypothetical protein SKAU_G00179500 [Synaphobranchus kaupii]|uniref:DISC1 scaffold protein n=1 Tax=Synaphobranchus kaupii TaxID=118154 RepID=A0A9Q1J1J1_SYNKA|nr:hypothetical protein SKAU_G00179500 [Synaphobranchus kaupii]